MIALILAAAIAPPHVPEPTVYNCRDCVSGWVDHGQPVREADGRTVTVRPAPYGYVIGPGYGYAQRPSYGYDYGSSQGYGYGYRYRLPPPPRPPRPVD